MINQDEIKDIALAYSVRLGEAQSNEKSVDHDPFWETVFSLADEISEALEVDILMIEFDEKWMVTKYLTRLGWLKLCGRHCRPPDCCPTYHSTSWLQ